MKKITFNALLNHKAHSYKPMQIEVEKVIPLYGMRFEQMKNHPLDDCPEITENRELMYMEGNTAHCILFLDGNGSDGILVEAEGADYARKSEFISNARAIVEANDITAGERQLHAELKGMANRIAELAHTGQKHFIFENMLGDEDLRVLMIRTVAEMLDRREDLAEVRDHYLGITGQADFTVTAKPTQEMKLHCPLEIQAEPKYDEDEDFDYDDYKVIPSSCACAKSDPRFVEELNQKKPKTIEKIKELWYRGNMSEQYRHYSNTRYHALNLHSYFQHGHYEIRCCNASLHAGEVRAQIVLALAISNAAMTKKYCSPSVSHSDNMRYSFRVWLLNLGLIGDEYKNCRTHLLKHLTGDIAWRHPEDGVAQRERLRQERIAERERSQQNESPCDERVATVCDDRQEVVETPDENLEAAVSDCDDFEETEDEGMAMSM